MKANTVNPKLIQEGKEGGLCRKSVAKLPVKVLFHCLLDDYIAKKSVTYEMQAVLWQH